jgi:hypothetical protein
MLLHVSGVRRVIFFRMNVTVNTIYTLSCICHTQHCHTCKSFRARDKALSREFGVADFHNFFAKKLVSCKASSNFVAHDAQLTFISATQTSSMKHKAVSNMRARDSGLNLQMLRSVALNDMDRDLCKFIQAQRF